MTEQSKPLSAVDIRRMQDAARTQNTHVHTPDNVQKAADFVAQYCYDTAEVHPDAQSAILTVNKIIEGIDLDIDTTPDTIKELIVFDVVDALRPLGFAVNFMYDIRDITALPDAPIRIYWSEQKESQQSSDAVMNSINANIGALHDKLATLSRVEHKIDDLITAVDNIKIPESKTVELKPVLDGISKVEQDIRSVSDKVVTNEYLIRGLDCY